VAATTQGWMGVALYERGRQRMYGKLRRNTESNDIGNNTDSACADSVAGASAAILKQSAIVRAGLRLLQIRSSNPAWAALVSRRTWAIHGLVAAVLINSGSLSFHRPAADIFAAGTVQSLSSIFLVIGGLADCASMEICRADDDSKPKHAATTAWKKLGLAFTLNSPLIVLYPWLIYSRWSLGIVNSYLHFWLAIAWGTQWWVIERDILCPGPCMGAWSRMVSLQ